MQICIPVVEDKGLQSRVSAHFGSAPAFMIVDTESGACRAIANTDAITSTACASRSALWPGSRWTASSLAASGWAR